MSPILWLLTTVIDIYIIFVVAQVVLSWLVAFDVVNMRNQFVGSIGNALYQLTEPVLGRIRPFTVFGGLDLSPLVVLLGLAFLKRVLLQYWPI